MSSPRWKTEEIFAAVEELRAVAGDGPRARKLLDVLFRRVHTLKANAAGNGLKDLAAAAHEFENVLHSLRTQTLQQSIAEGARIFLVHASFDIADFDRQFQRLKETLSETGEVISTAPTIYKDKLGKVNFEILYAQTRQPDLSGISEVTVEEVSLPATPGPQKATNELRRVERAFEKFAAELMKLPADLCADVFEQAVKAGHAAAVETGKEVEFEVRSHELEQRLGDAISDALIHLVRNAVDHGIEARDERVRLGKPARGKVIIEAATLGGQTRITVTDDGRGIDPTVIDSIFDPGFSTATEVSQISGRGVGLDVVKTQIEDAGGSVKVNSQLGQGSRFEITLPR